jgi:hypothetical protein
MKILPIEYNSMEEKVANQIGKELGVNHNNPHI